MKIMIFHASAGYGHFKIGEVIAKAFHARGIDPKSCTLEDALDSTPPSFKKMYTDLYFYSVKHIPKIWGWCYETLDQLDIYALIRPLRSLHNRFYGKKLLKRVIQEAPDVIITTHFLSAELFATAKRQGKLKSLLITVVTDFLPHTVWVNDGTDFYWVMGEDAKKDLLRRKVPEKQIIAGGIPIDPAFTVRGDREKTLRKWGLEKNRLTILLTSGSFGLGPQEAILEALQGFSDKIQCFVVCGNNKSLLETLTARKYKFPTKIFGFVNWMPELMDASDLLIAKTGGATTSESLSKELPMVVLEPIPGQETRNANVLRANHAAFFMIQPEEIKTIVQTILQNPQLLEEKREAAARLARPSAAEDLVTFVLDRVKIRA